VSEGRSHWRLINTGAIIDKIYLIKDSIKKKKKKNEKNKGEKNKKIIKSTRYWKVRK